MNKKRLQLNGGKQLGLMMVVTSIAQVLAIFKSTITAANFGACVELDAYNFANNLSNFFLTFVSAGITTVIIPSYIKKEDKDAINTFISVIFSIVGILLLSMLFASGFLVDVLTNRDAIFKGYVCGLMGLSILTYLLPAILGVTTAYYQTEGKYNIPKVILLISNVVVVAILFVMRNFTIYEYLWVLLAGAIIQFVLDIAIAYKLGFRYYVCFKIKNPQFKELFNIFLPTVFSSGIYKVNTMIDSLLSSSMGTGQLTLLSYSNVMIGMVNNMFIGNLSTYAYPKIVKAIKEDQKKGQKELWKYATAFHGIICLIISGFITVGREFIAMLYEHGKFTPESTGVVYLCMCIYIFGQQNNVVRDLIYRYFYSQGDTKGTTANSFSASIVNLILSVILSRFMGIYGLVLGTMLCGVYSLCAITFRMKKKYGFLISVRPVIFEFIKDEVALIISAVVVLTCKSLYSINYFVDFILYGCLTVVIYLGILIITKTQLFKIRL